MQKQIKMITVLARTPMETPLTLTMKDVKPTQRIQSTAASNMTIKISKQIRCAAHVAEVQQDNLIQILIPIKQPASMTPQQARLVLINGLMISSSLPQDASSRLRPSHTAKTGSPNMPTL